MMGRVVGVSKAVMPVGYSVGGRNLAMEALLDILRAEVLWETGTSSQLSTGPGCLTALHMLCLWQAQATGPFSCFCVCCRLPGSKSEVYLCAFPWNFIHK